MNFSCHRCNTTVEASTPPDLWEHWANERGLSVDLCPACLRSFALFLRHTVGSQWPPNCACTECGHLWSEHLSSANWLGGCSHEDCECSSFSDVPKHARKRYAYP